MVPLIEMLIERLGVVEDGVRRLQESHDRIERLTVPKDLSDIRPCDMGRFNQAGTKDNVLRLLRPRPNAYLNLECQPSTEQVEVLKGNGFEVLKLRAEKDVYRNCILTWRRFSGTDPWYEDHIQIQGYDSM